MKKKALLITFGTLALSTTVCGLAACGGDKRDAASPENEYGITYRSDWQGENDADMKIDGSLDEARWQNKNWYTTCAPYGAVNDNVWMKTTAFTTKYGLYIGAVLYDDNIVGDGEFNVTQGTCLEYHYTFRKQDGKLYNASYTDRGRFFLDVFGNYCTKGERMKRGVRVDGVVNSGETKSATFEVFVPWEQAGVEITEDWYPDKAYVLPGCRVISEGQTYSLCTLGMVSERWRRDYQAMYYEFDENGYTKADEEGATLGDAKNGFAKSAGWNLDKLSEGEVSLDKTYEYDYIFFRNAFANNFEASMTIYPGEYLYDTDNGIVYDTNGLAMYRDGRSGFYLLTTTGQEFIPYLEYNNLVETKTEGIKAPSRYHLRSLDNFVSAWHVSDDVCDIPNTEKAGAVKFSMIKYGADLFYFADGIYLGTQRVSSLSDSVYVGLYNCNRAATYKDYDFKAYTDDEVKARLNENNVYPVNVSAQAGGKVECAQTWVKKGETLTFKAICDSGYLVDTIKLGETDITESCKNNVQRYGKYTVTVTDSADISVTFKELAENEYSTISGMVYSGTDEKPSAATLKFASLSDASIVYTVRATSAKGYSVSLPDGKYSVFVTFGTKDAATQEITVNGDGTHDIRSTPLNVEVGNIKITDEGYYATEYSVTNNRCYIDTAVSGQPFVMETTVKDMSDKTWPSVGFILSTGGNNWIKFVLRLACPGDVTDYYDTLIWHDVYDNPDSPYYVRVVNFTDNALKTNPFTGENGTAKIRLVYTRSVYYFYVNDALIYSIDQDEAIQAGDSHTIAGTLGEGNVNLGLFAERQITFTNWNVSKTYDDIWNLIGRTVTAEGYDLAVGGKSVTDGKVLLGDEVTVSVAAQNNGTFMLDGNMIATEVVDGKSIAKFTVTGNHTVTYSVSYAVTGTVTGGNENTTVTIANEQGIAVYTGKTDANGNYTASLADGTYYVSAQSATQITNVASVNVNGAAATVGAIAFEKPIIDAWATGNQYAIDYKTGNYCSAAEQNQNGGWFAGIEVQSNSYYVLEATAKDMPTPTDQYPSAGFMVGTQENWLRFTVQWDKDHSVYRFVLWRSNDGPIVGQNVEAPFANGSMSVKLVYANGTYYFYTNDSLVYTTSTESVGDGTGVGLFNDWQITFTDWKYTSGRAAVASYLGKALTVADVVEVKVNGEVVMGTTVNVLIGDEVTVSVAAQEGKTFNIVLDNSGIPTAQENGKAVATFTVTDNHSVSYSVAYAVTGTVTDGDENTVVTIVGENGAVAYTGNANADGSFTATLPNGTYYVSAQSTTKITNVASVEVSNQAVTVDDIAFTRPLITNWFTGYNQYNIDYKTGAYKTVEGQQYHGGWFAGNAADAYVLTATLKDMTDTANWSCDGFMVGTQDNWMRFTIQYNKDNGTYRFVLWRSNGDPTVGQNVETPFASGSLNIKLVFANGTYYFYVNDAQIYTTSESVGSDCRVGLYTEYRITVADWNYSAGKDAVASYLGKTLTVADGVEVKVNGKVVTGATVDVLIGDEVTVSVAAQEGKTYNIVLDNSGIPTAQENGKAVATFTVTDNHSVSYSVAYAVTGTVTDGDENTVVTIVGENGAVAYSGNANADGSFAATLPNGTFYVSAQSATQITNVVTFTVEDAAATIGAIAFEKPIIDAWATGNEYTIDYTTGNYCSAADKDKNGGWFAGIEVQSSTYYVLEATAKDMPTPADQYPSAGFMVGTQDNWMRFTIQYNKDNGTYRFVLWRSNGDPIVGNNVEAPFASGSMNVKLVYANRTYYFYTNGELVYTTNTESLGEETARVGLFNDWQITFTDWSYTSGRDAVASYLGKELTVADGVEVKINDEATSVTGGKVNVLLGDTVTVSVNASTGETLNMMLDGSGIETTQENGKAVASFTVTKDHTVNYSVAYTVTGTVTGGDENTTVTIVGENGAVAYTGNANADGSFTATLPNGTYYVSAQSTTQITNVDTFTVNDAAFELTQSLTFSRAALNAEVGNFTFDYTTGNYTTAHGDTNNRAYFAQVASGTSFVLEATLKDMGTTESPSAGVILKKDGEKNWVRFVVANMGGAYKLVIWRDLWNTPDYFGKVFDLPASPFTGDNGTLNLKVVYHNGIYSIYLNETLTAQVTENDKFDNDNTIAGALGNGTTLSLGVFAERDVTFTDWGYSSGREAVSSYLGKELTVANGVKVTINAEEASVTDGKVNVLLGDTVTVSVNASTGETLNMMLDGSGIETTQENGKAVASFTVTDNHSVNYSAAYEVTGTVTGGNADTVVMIVGENGAVVHTGNANADGSFAATLPNGTYYVSAQSATQITNIASVNVNGAAATVNAIAFEKPLITDWVTDYNHYTVDYKTGAYKTVEGQQFHGGWFAGNAADAYVLTATVKDMSNTTWACVGFMVGTTDSWLRFTVQFTDVSTYRFVLWRSNGDPTVGQNVETPFASGSMNIKLVFANGTYYFYVNDAQIYTTSESAGSDCRVGLYNEYRITFVNWQYSSGRDAVTEYLGKTLTAEDGITVKVGEISVTDGKVLLGDEVTVSIAAQPNGTFMLGENMLDTTEVDGMSYATFKVTGDHTVTYTTDLAAVSGTVSALDGETLGNVILTVSNASGETVWSGTTSDGTFTTKYLAFGTYYIVAKNDTRLASAEFTTIAGETPSSIALTLDRLALTIDAGSGAVDYKGNYQTVQDDTNNRAYFKEIGKGEAFTLEATMKGMGDGSQWPSSGFILSTGENSWIKFVVRNGNGNHDIVVWRNIDGDLYCATVANFSDDTMKQNPFTEADGTLRFKLSYAEGTYKLFVNDALIFQIEENTEIQNGHTIASILGDGNVKLGLFAERQITFTDWKYTANA